jgi:sulfur-carrier protein
MILDVVLPGYLQPFAGGRRLVKVEDGGATVGEVLQALRSRYPGVYDRVVTEDGKVRPHVNVFVDDESIRYMEGLATPTENARRIVILPAVSGG